MLKNNHISLTGVFHAILLATWLTACSGDPFVDDSGVAGESVVFSGAFNGIVTRAGTNDNLWPANTEVTISNGTSQINYTTGATPSTTSGAPTSLTAAGSEQFIWPTVNPNWSFSAWYPAGNAVSMSIGVAANQNGLSDDAYHAYDLLYCPPMTVTFRQKPINLVFLHQMARIVVIVNSSYTEKKETVTDVKYGDGHIALSRNINTLTTESANGVTTWKDGTQNSTIIMRPNTAMTNTSSHVYGFECIVPPQTYDTKIDHLVNISTTGATKGNRTYYFGDTFDLKSGFQYTYNLLISEQGVITVATVEVTDWTTGTPISNMATIPNSSYPSSPIE